MKPFPQVQIVGSEAKWQKRPFSIDLSVSFFFFTKSQFLYPMPVGSERLKHLMIKIYSNFMSVWYFMLGEFRLSYSSKRVDTGKIRLFTKHIIISIWKLNFATDVTVYIEFILFTFLCYDWIECRNWYNFFFFSATRTLFKNQNSCNLFTCLAHSLSRQNNKQLRLFIKILLYRSELKKLLN